MHGIGESRKTNLHDTGDLCMQVCKENGEWRMANGNGDGEWRMENGGDRGKLLSEREKEEGKKEGGVSAMTSINPLGYGYIIK